MRWILLLALVASCAKKKEQPVPAETENAAKTESAPKAESPAKTEPSAGAGYVPIPDHDLLVQLAPGLGAKPLDDAPGFANADGTFRLTVRELNSTDPKTIEEAKSRLRRTIKDVLREENTPDGYILTFTMKKTEMVEDSTGRVTRDESGVDYNLQMRRTVDGQPYKCSVTMSTKDLIPIAIDACQSIKKKS